MRRRGHSARRDAPDTAAAKGPTRRQRRAAPADSSRQRYFHAKRQSRIRRATLHGASRGVPDQGFGGASRHHAERAPHCRPHRRHEGASPRSCRTVRDRCRRESCRARAERQGNRGLHHDDGHRERRGAGASVTGLTQAQTPLMQQYRDIKARHQNALLFFRMGEFYEMFYEDAETAARVLGFTLTSRNNGGAADVPLAGVPVKALQEYLRRLVQFGYRVAICEQVEDPKLARGIVRREVVETVTPGVTFADDLLDGTRNNFICALSTADRAP